MLTPTLTLAIAITILIIASFIIDIRVIYIQIDFSLCQSFLRRISANNLLKIPQSNVFLMNNLLLCSSSLQYRLKSLFLRIFSSFCRCYLFLLNYYLKSWGSLLAHGFNWRCIISFLFLNFILI